MSSQSFLYKMNNLIHPTYIDPATHRLVMTADPLKLTSAIHPGDASTFFNLPDTTYVNTYIPPPVVPFNGNPLSLIIDTTKVPELNVKANRAPDETSSPLAVPGDDVDASDIVEQENVNPQTNRSRGSKRKATPVEEDSVPVPRTKRKKAVLKAKKVNKKTEDADSAGANEKPFKCPHCNYSAKRQFNLKTHIKTHDSNRVKEFVCLQCNKAFTRKHDRDRHVVNIHK